MKITITDTLPLAKIHEACQTTQMRAGAILEDAMRDGRDVATEYDVVASTFSDAGFPVAEVETIKCSWTIDDGFSGTGYLHSQHIPYALESVYRRAYAAGVQKGVQKGLADITAQFNGNLYRRVGRRFSRIA